MQPVYIFGEPEEGGIVDVFEKASRDVGHAVSHYTVVRHLRSRVTQNSASTVLYCLGPGSEDADGDILAMSGHGSRVIVLAHETKYNSPRAVRALHNGAHDFLSYATFPKTDPKIHLLTSSNGSPYPAIGPSNWRIDRNSTVFIITSFAEPERSRFELACRTALDALQLKPVFGDSEIHPDAHLLQKLAAYTRDACLTIANLSEPLNVNVAIEIGLAWGMQKTCLGVWRRNTRAPANLRGVGRLDYDDEVDVAKGIFKGLQPRMRS